MKWAFENKDYYMAYILYTELKVGIPNSFLYKLPAKKTFRSVRDFIETSYNVQSNDEYLNKIFVLFLESKYTRLTNWGNKFGYVLK